LLQNLVIEKASSKFGRLQYPGNWLYLSFFKKSLELIQEAVSWE